MFLTDKEIKTIQTSQLKGELKSCIRLANKILEELEERGED
jgi:hypothetical protein|tara:strand:- start:1047 stop:1169 length:123 start_codon:yes stop_codon:yes gene_type:complete